MNDAGANNKNGLLEKGRSGILHVIFGRSGTDFDSADLDVSGL